MSERTMEALRDRINARLQTKAISRDRASAAGREVVAQCRQSDVETLEWVLSEIDAALATPEPGGEGKQHRCGSCDAPVDDTGFIGHGVVRCQRCCEESVVGMGGPTPAASEGVRERVRQAVGWGIEDAWPRYNRIYDPHDPDDESRQEWVDCITEQVVTALLRTPRGEGEAVRRIATVALVLQRRGAPYDEVVSVGVWPEPGEFAALVKLTAGDFYDLAALRSEAQGELVKEAVALIDEAVSEIAGDCQCYEEDGEVVLCWTCRAMNWSDRAERQEGSSDE